ncbi:hypothetical protein FACS189437_00060 [Bacteroidia bacterium]|nr:hypothetical protein FACS189437_00060 [Bacteroidia bacterium]
MNTQISIIVPVYNVEKYIRQCVDSLLLQTYSNIEIILVDDGSTDSSVNICDEYATKDSRIKVIHQSNVGVSQARNNGIKQAEGEWITFCDSDDWCDMTMCENIIKYIDEDIDIITWGFTYYADGQYLKKEKQSTIPIVYNGSQTKLLQLDLFTKKYDKDFINDTNVILGTCWGKLYRKERIQDISFLDGLHPHEDSFFNYLVFERSRKVIFIHESYNYYRIIAESGCNRYKPQEAYSIQNAVSLLDAYIKNSRYDKDYRFKSAFSVYCLNMVRILIKNVIHKDNPENVTERISTLKRNLDKNPLRSGILNYSTNNKISLKDILLLFLIRFRLYSLLYNVKKWILKKH